MPPVLPARTQVAAVLCLYDPVLGSPQPNARAAHVAALPLIRSWLGPPHSPTHPPNSTIASCLLPLIFRIFRSLLRSMSVLSLSPNLLRIPHSLIMRFCPRRRKLIASFSLFFAGRILLGFTPTFFFFFLCLPLVSCASRRRVSSRSHSARKGAVCLLPTRRSVECRSVRFFALSLTLRSQCACEARSLPESPCPRPSPASPPPPPQPSGVGLLSPVVVIRRPLGSHPYRTQRFASVVGSIPPLSSRACASALLLLLLLPISRPITRP